MISGTSRFVRLRGLRFHLRCWGAVDAPLLVLTHGWLDTSATWSDVGARLGERFNVVALDQRGYGYSEWPQDGYWFPDYLGDLDALIEHLAPAAPIALVGHSMGGQIASVYAGLRPERIGKLVVLDSLFLPDMPATLAPKRVKRWLDQLKDLPREKTYASFEELVYGLGIKRKVAGENTARKRPPSCAMKPWSKLPSRASRTATLSATIHCCS